MRRFLAFGVPAGVVMVLAACTTNALVAKGGACFQSIDCQEGLVCIPTPGADGGGTCTDDLTTIVSLPEAGSDAPASVDATGDGPVPDTGPQPDTGTQDTGTQDTGTQDTGSTQDTGTADAPAD